MPSAVDADDTRFGAPAPMLPAFDISVDFISRDACFFAVICSLFSKTSLESAGEERAAFFCNRVKHSRQGAPPPVELLFEALRGEGRQPFLLDETERPVRLHSLSTGALGGDLWARLATDVKGVDQLVRFRHAVVTCKRVSHGIS